jgi:hypothetical protein
MTIQEKQGGLMMRAIVFLVALAAIRASKYLDATAKEIAERLACDYLRGRFSVIAKSSLPRTH